MENAKLSWAVVAEYLDRRGAICPDYEKREFVCPICGKVFREEDEQYIPAEVDFSWSEIPQPFCDNCGAFLEDV